MKRIVYLAFFVLLMSQTGAAEEAVDFSTYFLDQTLRIDTFHGGDNQEEEIVLDKLYLQGAWAGNPKNLIDASGFGRYQVRLHDGASDRLIFCRGFDSYFGDFQATTLAAAGRRTFGESVLIPLPRHKAVLILLARDSGRQWRMLFKKELDPANVVANNQKVDPAVLVIPARSSGSPHEKVDVAFIGEGYTAAQEEKFRRDLERLAGIFLSQEPYKSLADKFNIWGVFKASAETGCDEPGYGSYKNTALEASFDTFGLERYLLVEDNRRLRDVAAAAPYDALVVMVNHARYGGGGLYNTYCALTVDSAEHTYLLLHEFGHSFGGLADEYYTSAVAYENVNPIGVEPVEPNVTAMLATEGVKWQALLTPKIPLPTPWEKARFEELETPYQKKRQELNQKIAGERKLGNPSVGLENELQALTEAHARDVERLFSKSRFRGKVGAFEGAGYTARGLYRPMLDCLMFTRGTKPLCRVCASAMERVIRFYAQ